MGTALATKCVASVMLATYWLPVKGVPVSSMPTARPVVELTVTVVEAVLVVTTPSEEVSAWPLA